MRSERRTDAGPEGRGSDFQFHPSETLSKPRGELKPRSRWSGIRTSPIKGDGRIRTELAPLGRGDQALLGSTLVRSFLLFQSMHKQHQMDTFVQMKQLSMDYLGSRMI